MSLERLAVIAALSSGYGGGLVRYVNVAEDDALLDVVPDGQEKPSRMVRTYRPDGFDPAINFNTGKPHTHSREIARRLRQQARTRGEGEL